MQASVLGNIEVKREISEAWTTTKVDALPPNDDTSTIFRHSNVVTLACLSIETTVK